MPDTPHTLEELLDIMTADGTWDGAPVKHDELDWCSLPTFGGTDPDDTAEVWSWDAESLIVGTCADDVRIIKRGEWLD